jgi:hypothetical protein
MTETLSYFPGQLVTVFQEMKDINGVRTDGYGAPVVSRIVLPTMTLASGYPQTMTRLDIGLYYFQFTLPTGAASVGSYLVDISFLNPTTGLPNNSTYQVVVTAPFGNFGVSVGTVV